MIGFVVSAILSATLGQANDAFNWLAATLTRDIYVPLKKRFANSEPAETEQLRFARLTMFLVGAFGTVTALYIPKLGGAFAFALEYYSLGAAFMMPVALGMVFRRTPWWSGMASCSAAIITAVTLMALGLWKDQAFTRNMLSEATAASLVFFGSALWFRKDDPRHATLLVLERDLREPVIAEQVEIDYGALRVYRLLGQVCIVLAVVLGACVTLPSGPVSPSMINLAAGLFLLALGSTLIYSSRERRS
jgi:hypothetical protein